MATADQYAAWIVQNRDKKGTSDFETVAKAYQQAKAEELKSVPSASFSVKDLALSAGQGLAGGIQALTDLAGAGNVVSKKLGDIQQSAGEAMSPERQAEIYRREQIKKAAEGDTWEEIKATLGGLAEAPLQTGIQALASSAPIIAGSFLAPPAAAAATAGRVGMAAKALSAAKNPATGIGALMGLGGQKGQDYETVKRELILKGYSEPEAERLAQKAAEYSLENLPRQLASTAAGGLEGALGIETALGRLGKAAPKVEKAIKDVPEPTFGQALRRNVLEEALPEALQATTGQVGTNIALNQAGLETDLTKGVAAQAIHDLLVGGGLGAITSPAKLSSMRKEFVANEMAGKEEYAKQQREAIAAEQAKINATKEQFGVGKELLALPAPQSTITKEEEVPPLQNPIGNLTTDELGPEVTRYVNKYRKDNGLPFLKSYSIEDIKDAMTAVNPEGEKAALDSILAAKTGYTGEQNFTSKDVENAAIEKNIATGTKGFNDFLARTTGVNNLQEMSEPQLYAAFKALADMPANLTGQQIVLPEGTNASRFKQSQYDNAVKMVGLTFDERGGKPLSVDTILEEIKEATNLETDRDARAVLDTAIKSGDLTESKQTVYRTYKPENDQLVSTYPTRAAADVAAKKQGLNVREATLTQVAPKAAPVIPSKPRAGLPAGYDITERQFKEGEEPEGYQITSEAGGKPFPTVLDKVAVQGKIDQLSADRQEIAAEKLQEVMKYEDTVNQGKRELEKMEAAGDFDSDLYKQKRTRQAAKEDLLGKRIDALYKEIEGLTAKLVSKPVGSKPVARTGYTITKEGKETGTFPTREAAEESILADLSDEALDALVSDKKFGGLSNRAAAEQNRRRSAPPTKGKKVSEVLGALNKEKPLPQTPEFKQQVEILRKMLDKFGLGDVALKIVNAIENQAEGSYAAKVIQLAIDARKPIITLRHESLHALKELGFFTPQQWATLEKMAKAEWIDKYLKGAKVTLDDGRVVSRYDAYVEINQTMPAEWNKNNPTQPPRKVMSKAEMQELLVEEAIAEAFGRFDSSKAPPGMLSALLNKMRNFFDALGNYLASRGFQSSRDIFGQIEAGKLKAGKATPSGTTKQSLIRAAVDDETEISTQNPQGKTRKYDPITDMLSIDEAAVREAMEMKPDIYDRTVRAIKGYGFIPTDTPNRDVISTFKRNIINNLLFLHDQVPEDIRVRSKLWYDGANRIAVDMAKNYGVSKEQVSAIMAAMSPQKDWFQNVSMAERALDVMTEQGDKSWDDNMLKYAKSYVDEAASRKEREKRELAFKQIQNVARAGTSLNDMDINDAAAFIRAYDEAYHSREYRIVTPEGGFGDLVRKNDGNPATMMWSTYDPIKKSVSIFRNGSRKNISEQLGEEHKIRSFYNNIAAPNSDIGHVTIDTHAVAAGLFEALAGTDTEVAQNFGGTGGSDIIGVGGTYGIIADAYREAAAQRNLRAREMQSITWEAVRGLFGEDIKSTIKPKVRAEWAKYKNGEQTFNATRDKVIEIAGGIDDPDWVGSGSGDFVSNGATSYDKTFTPEGGVRLREAQDIREGLTFNLSAVTNSIPGLRELYDRAMSRDKNAYTLLQRVAESSLKYLLSGTSARTQVEYAKGVYLSDREPSISVGVRFPENEMSKVLARLAKFADSYNQQQIHVRQETAQKFGHDFGDGSYATAVFQINLKKALSNEGISRVIDESGLQGFTITDKTLTTYFVRTEGDERENFKSFKERIKRVNELVGDGVSRPKQRVERLYVYGDGDGARIPYSQITFPVSDIRTKQESDTVTPKLIAEYLNKAPVTTFKQKPLNAKQVKEQKRLAKAFDAMPINDLKNPLVKRAYSALTKSLEEQFKVLPIKVEMMDVIDEPYANSNEVRRDVSLNNRFKVYATSPETFGPPGSNFKNHPLLKDSGLKDVKGRPMLYNDLLRAVHDYFAHNLTETQFGPNGEAAAWRNHMAMTADPFARWALTAETRAQNAWQNFRPEAKGLSLIERGFADQKASLPPLEFVMTGDAKVDEPIAQLKELLTPEQQRGSVPTTAKYSLREAPDTPAFKSWFGDSVVITKPTVRFEDGQKIVEAGKPKVMYHGTSQNISTFKPKQAGAIFVTDDPDIAEGFSKDSQMWMAAHADQFLTPEQLDKGVKQAIKIIRSEYGNDSLGKEMIASLASGKYSDATAEAQMTLRSVYKNMLPSNPNIMPVYVSAQNPFDYANPTHVQQVVDELNKNFDSYGRKIGDKEKGDIARGNWERIEKAHVQKAIKDLNFDGFYVSEGGKKNLAVYEPSQIKSATGNIGTYDATNPDIRYSLRDATDAFDPAVVEDASEQGYKSKEKLVSMPITDFLKLAEFGHSKRKQDDAEQRVKAGTKFTTIPYLEVYEKYEDGLRVTGHEGRHRARALLAEGKETMPVVLRGDIRWSEQNDPDKFDYVEQWPERIYAQKGAINEYASIPMPVTREESVEDYQVKPLPTLKYSVRNIEDEVSKLPNGVALNASIDRIATRREEKGWIERLLSAFVPDSVDALRQQWLNRYERLSTYDKRLAEQMGGPALLADASAEAAALMSDNANAIAAQACGMSGEGGIPVFKNGFTTIDTSVKGLMELLKPLAEVGDPRIYQTYQFWAGAKRGSRLISETDKNGNTVVRDHTYTPAEIAFAKSLCDVDAKGNVTGKYPEFAQVQKDWIKYNDGLVKYQVDTGVLSAARAAEYTKYADYIPFYRQFEGQDTVGPKIFQSISGVKPPKKLKGIKEGQEAPFADFLETLVRNTQAAVNAGMKNVAAQRAVGIAVKLDEAVRLDKVTARPGTVTVLENGEAVSYEVADQLFIDAVKSLNIPELPFLSILSAPANALRNLVTKDPGFMMANLMRDSLSAWVTSGHKMTPIASTISNFASALQGKDPVFLALKRAGAIGGYDFAQDVETSGRSMGRKLRRETGTQTGTEQALRPVNSVWEALERGTEASDAATRMAVYKSVMERTGNEAEAIYRAMEVMNFNRKGNLAIVRILTAAVPFLNARMQGLDVFYRAGISPTFRKIAYGENPTAEQKALQKTFFIRGATLTALTTMYWMLTHDDDEYKRQEQEVRDNNWLLPFAGARVPIPFEVGVLFKVIPERILEYSFGDDTGKDLSESMGRALQSTFAFNPIPQTFLPLEEARTNYSFFTGRPIVGQGMEGVAPEFQVGPNTTKIAQTIGGNLGVSPMKVDHVIQGYTGTMGMYLVDMIDSILSSNDASPKADKRFEQMPIIKRFALDKEAKGTVSAYYDLKNSVDEVVRTVNLLERTGKVEDIEAYITKNAAMFAAQDYVKSVESNMKDLREALVKVRSSDMTGAQKRDAIKDLTEAQNQLTSQIKAVKKEISKSK